MLFVVFVCAMLVAVGSLFGLVNAVVRNSLASSIAFTVLTVGGVACALRAAGVWP